MTPSNKYTFELGIVNNRQNTRIYRYQSQKSTVPPIQTEKFSSKIHTFCCINWNGKFDVRIYVDYARKRRGREYRMCHLRMDTETTIDSFSNYLIPFLHEIGEENQIVLMNGA